MSPAAPTLRVIAMAIVLVPLPLSRGEPRWAESDPRDARVHTALARVYSDVKYHDLPLRDAIEHFRALLGVNVHVEWRMLDEYGVAPDARVRLDLKRASGRTILDLMLEEAAGETKVQFFVRDGVLVITCEHFDRNVILRTYSIRDLVAPGRDALQVRDWESDEIKARANDLASIITDLIEPDRWRVNGGPYSVEWLDGVLSVRAGPDVHAQLKALLTALRQVGPGEDRAILPDQDASSAENEGARAALDEVLPSVRFDKTLGDALRWIEREYDAGMHVLWSDLKEMHVTPERPVAMRLENVSIRETLKLLLSEQEATFDVEEGVLLIGTGGRVGARPMFHAHSVADLNEGAPQRMNRLVEVIRNTIEPDSWIENGGFGSIIPFDGLLLVRNNAQAQIALRHFLISVRQSRAARDEGKSPPPATERP